MKTKEVLHLFPPDVFIWHEAKKRTDFMPVFQCVFVEFAFSNNEAISTA